MEKKIAQESDGNVLDKILDILADKIAARLSGSLAHDANISASATVSVDSAEANVNCAPNTAKSDPIKPQPAEEKASVAKAYALQWCEDNNLSTRIYNMIDGNYQGKTVDELIASINSGELANIRGFGKTSILELQQALKREYPGLCKF